MDKEIKNEEKLSQTLMDWIVDDEIRRLLSDLEYYEKQMPGDKYNLTVKNQLDFLESYFKNGVKELPHAYKELKPAAKSMLECLQMKDGSLSILGSFTLDKTTISVEIPGLSGTYYIEIKDLKRLLKECARNVVFRLSDEVCFVIVNLNRQTFIDECKAHK